ncbi:PREDICTED: photosynthetic NDH subunit of subcomplex B 5, chloroplastic [Ipomoea nil]|uniref:photosynthetic NDH subunit of subcomplex B 5, chloroplastic n=1 Tax=Ipomoea nil TaxID=35883 RepID=UPI000900B728|nr:PREDICTED: photosynthetic NDH subunit of subcomplex B 5, chloroplastic [Ipomoea nil]
MAGSETLSLVSKIPVPKLGSPKPERLCQVKHRVFMNGNIKPFSLNLGRKHEGKRPRKLHAGFAEIEPDLNEDPVDQFRTNGIAAEDFVYGKYDDHHTYYEAEDIKGGFWETLSAEYNSIGPPTGFQGFIAWMFLPAIAAGMYFNVPGEYLYIGAGVFTIIFCIIEMDKPSEAHNFEPQIYSMERGAREKLISDYNTMDIWDFNEKYGDLWDFTVTTTADDIMKR